MLGAHNYIWNILVEMKILL